MASPASARRPSRRSSDRPVIIATEEGLGTLDVPHFPLAKSFDAVMEPLAALYSEPHEFGTVVVDSVDWLEPLIWKKACEDNKWGSIEEPGYGKGYVAALDLWREYLDGLNALRDERGMTVIQIAHTDIKRFDSPMCEPYDRYVIKLHARAAALLQEHSDIVLFANYRISTVKSDVGFNKKVNRALGSGERVIHTEERPAFLAKNRYGLPDVLPLDWPPSPRPCPSADPNSIPSTQETSPWPISAPPSMPPPSTPQPGSSSFPSANTSSRSSGARCARPGTAAASISGSSSTCSKARSPGASSSTG